MFLFSYRLRGLRRLLPLIIVGSALAAPVWPATADPDPFAAPGVTAGPPPPSPEAQLPLPQINAEPNDKISRKQKRDLLKSNFEKMKQDVDELVDLAVSLQNDLDKTNENILSLDVLEKAKKIEKLAKKIKNAAKGW
jgi:hypothetical protein